MPELPEVEVVKRSLINKTQNLIIKTIKINDGRLRYKIDKKKIKNIIGLKFKKISRRSKYLLFFFNKALRSYALYFIMLIEIYSIFFTSLYNFLAYTFLHQTIIERYTC